jgi:L-aminopeptidase/D-esterase-like protein
MPHGRRLEAAVTASILLLSGCASTAGGALGEASSEAAEVELVESTGLSTVTLSAAAYERLGIETTPVRSSGGSQAGLWVLPLAAMLYDADGKTWVFTNPEERVFLRVAISLDHVDGDLAYLKVGPAAGTSVVTVGAAELWGAEQGVGEE